MRWRTLQCLQNTYRNLSHLQHLFFRSIIGQTLNKNGLYWRTPQRKTHLKLSKGHLVIHCTAGRIFWGRWDQTWILGGTDSLRLADNWQSTTPKPDLNCEVKQREHHGLGMFFCLDFLFLETKCVHHLLKTRRLSQQDNDPKHRSRSTTIKRPSRNPDLDPLEMSWHVLKSDSHGAPQEYHKLMQFKEECDCSVRLICCYREHLAEVCCRWRTFHFFHTCCDSLLFLTTKT